MDQGPRVQGVEGSSRAERGSIPKPAVGSSPADEPLLVMRGIEKVFPGVRALDGVDFDVRAGEVHALMGENGAGKSTLIKVLNGIHRLDGGSIALADRPFHAASPADALKKGISTVFQEVPLIPALSLAE